MNENELYNVVMGVLLFLAIGIGIVAIFTVGLVIVIPVILAIFTFNAFIQHFRGW